MEKKDNTVKWAGLVAAFVIVMGALVIFGNSSYAKQVKGVTASLPEIAKVSGDVEVFAESDINLVIDNLKSFLANPDLRNLDPLRESLEILER